jgi:poly-gamma-glutamate synthesis protein (capsule biosynthesis protein)
MFVSHGAPVLQGVEIYKNAPIFYGLGNFLFHTSHDDDEWSPRDVWKSVIATCHFDGEGNLEGIDLDPIAVGGPDALDDRTAARLPYPVLAEGWLAGEILGDLADRSNQYGTGLVKAGNRARLTIAG